ncbi:Myelin-associated glycoprotein [Nibea albiflora]|uniref:Myelin-associated glycoprotein n=1 Tax=Nibea albiflora TaxID=240163 RepID=A0ACB7F6K8_NIBAL|nr:Myelin-associated glycoprotein [Nibea albiflora]
MSLLTQMKLPGLIDLGLILILASHSKGQGWKISVDPRFNTTVNSDVTIKCSFTIPSKFATENPKVYWKKNVRSTFDTGDKRDQNAFVYHPNATFVLKKYGGNTELIGDIKKGNCTLKIKNIMDSDQGIYLRVIANDSYSFKRNLISIHVDDANSESPTFEFTTVMQLKLRLSFLLLHVIHDVQASPGQWTASVPARIPALEGSCVVIPCIYNYPKPDSKKPLDRWRGFWKKGNTFISTSLSNWKLLPEYKKRTSFLGKLAARNCTMQLNGVRQTDVGPFYFRIEMPEYKSFSYRKHPVSLDVISDPPPPSLTVKVNEKVTASCSVSHTCPTKPPLFSWSRPGSVKRRLKRLNKWTWQVVSTLTFVPLLTDYNKPLNCSVRYSGGKQAKSSMILRI